VSTLRTFIAVTPDEACREELARRIEPLQAQFPRLSWVKPGNHHLTLRFLGDTPEGLARRVPSILAPVSAEIAPFVISFGSFGFFPPRGAPRVFWVGVEEGREELIQLARSVEQCLHRAGLPREKKPFQPHLTLARVRDPRTAEGLDRAAATVPMPAPTARRVSDLHYYQSTLHPSGSIYTLLSSIPLIGK
jgi:RNA 2',3'-cyclic 3'-phosphodiesterase